MKRIVLEQYARAKKLLEDNRHLLEKLAVALLEYEVLDAEEIDKILSGEKLSREPVKPAVLPAAGSGPEPVWTPGNLTPTPDKA